MAKRKDDFYEDKPATSQKGKKAQSSKYPTVFDYLRFGESYTSLLLGIIVVIVAGMLFVSFVKKNNSSQMTQDTSSVSTIAQGNLTPTVLPNTPLTITTTAAPTEKVVATPTSTPRPTNTPTPTVRPTNTPMPTKGQPTPTKTVAKVTPTPTKPAPTKAITKPTVTPTPTTQVAQKITGKTYVTQKGDDLWHIAERAYGDGYKWVEIAKANNLTNPSLLYSNTKLILPSITPEPQVAQKSDSTKTEPVVTNPIKGNTYTVVKGDDLWDIAVRAYGDGYQWVKISQANKLTNPSVIFSGNVLTIPR